MLRTVVCVATLALALACSRDAGRRSDTVAALPKTAASDTTTLCPALPGRFVVTDDSVGPFAMHGTVTAQVRARCPGAREEEISRVGYMATVIYLRYPGVIAEAELETGLERVRRWEITGDSVYLPGGHRIPANVGEVAAWFGPGFVDNPKGNDTDGPDTVACALSGVTFRVGDGVPDGQQDWSFDDPKLSGRIPITGLMAGDRKAAEYVPFCNRLVKSLQRGQKAPKK